MLHEMQHSVEHGLHFVDIQIQECSANKVKKLCLNLQARVRVSFKQILANAYKFS